MKKFRLPIIYFSATFLCIFMLSGCLKSNNPKSPSVIEFGFTIDAGQNPYNFDSTLVSGKDKLTIQQFRFVMGGDSLVINDTTAARYKNKSQWQSFSVPNSFGRKLIGLYPPLRAPVTYKKLIFSVAQAPKSAIGVGIDPDFSSKNHNYSMIIEGTYNGGSFTYKSTKEFTKRFSLGPVDLPKYNAHYVFIVTADVTSWFSKNPDGSGGFYDPDAANTSDHLDSLFARRIWSSLDIELHSNQP